MTQARRPLLIVGAGGFAREAAEAVRAADIYELVGHLDDNPALHGATVGGAQVVGPVDVARDHEAAVIVATGRPSDYGSRRRLVERLQLDDDRYAQIIHPSTTVPPSCVVGRGTVLLAGVVLTSAVSVGSHVAVMPHVVLTHDDVVEDFVTIASGVRLGGGVEVKENAYLGAGALVREECRIGSGSLIGMGSVVTHDVPPGEVWAGVPARRIRAADAHL